MDYEKKYKEALERARTMLTNEVAADIFPELTESENERIRKAIIGHFKTGTEYVSFSGFSKGEIINWLEKQGEYTPIVMIPKFRVGDVIRPKGSTAEYAIESISGECYHGKGWGLHISGDNDYELVKQNNAWSEEDSPYYDDICEILINLIHSKTADVNKDVVQKDLDWFVSLKDRVQPQQEWSEEDEKKRNLLIAILNVNHPNGYFKVNPANTLNMEAMPTEELVSWLKSLRPQNRWISVDKEVYVKEPVLAQKKDKSDSFGGFVVCCDHTLTPNVYERYMILGNIVSRNTWKPSEEQIKAIQTAIGIVAELTPTSMLLKELKEQLKKLREE